MGTYRDENLIIKLDFVYHFTVSSSGRVSSKLKGDVV